jgi:hypothetical protein
MVLVLDRVGGLRKVGTGVAMAVAAAGVRAGVDACGEGAEIDAETVAVV